MTVQFTATGFAQFGPTNGYTLAEIVDTESGRIVGVIAEPQARMDARAGDRTAWGEFAENDLMFAVAGWLRDEFADTTALVVVLDPGRDDATEYPASELLAIL